MLDGARRVTVVPVANEQTLRTRAWVEHNRRVVDSLSQGKLAYVYLPNTGGPGYTSFNRYYFAQQDKQGAVIDERYNGGGQAADYIIDVLQRDFDGYFNNVAGERMPFTSPAAGIWGPKVMIINEMAGSGGDLMPYMFRYRKIGTLVGKRTWGGLVHTADTPPFVDGGSAIAPRGGFFARDGKWAVENEGVAPDIDVENTPKEVIAGHDLAARARDRCRDEAAQGSSGRAGDEGAAVADVGQAGEAAGLSLPRLSSRAKRGIWPRRVQLTSAQSLASLGMTATSIKELLKRDAKDFAGAKSPNCSPCSRRTTHRPVRSEATSGR